MTREEIKKGEHQVKPVAKPVEKQKSINVKAINVVVRAFALSKNIVRLQVGL